MRKVIPGVLVLASILNPTGIHGQTLGEALDATNLTWTTSGTISSFGWSPTSVFPHDGTNDASSGRLSFKASTSTLQTSLTGPGTLNFWWRNDSFACALSFVAGTNVLAIFGGPYPSWQHSTYYLGPGTQTFKWIYSVRSASPDAYSAYVDGVNYVPGATAPVIVTPPLGQSQVRGLDATFTVEGGGTPPINYQWQFEGSNIPGATSTAFTITNVQSSNLGNYTVALTNSGGWNVSSNAPLEFGQVTAWGSPGSGATTVPPGATNVLAASAGWYFNVLLKADGSVPGWGANPYGQAVAPAGLSNVIAVATGSAHSSALRSDGTVTAWGDNSFGQTNVPPSLTNIVAITAGDFHTLALTADGRVVAWGPNSGQTNVPPGLSNVVAVAGGGFLSLALTADGTVTEWSGQSAPADLSNVVAIAAGGAHYLALIADGTVAAWGQNDKGQAGVPLGLSNVVKIDAGGFHSLALRADGTVVAWGSNDFGLTNVPTGLTNVIAISAGEFHNLAVVGDGPPVLQAAITNPSWSTNGFQLSIPSQSGRVYSLQYKESLTDSSWVSLPLVAGTGSTIMLADRSATSPARVYRVLRW